MILLHLGQLLHLVLQDLLVLCRLVNTSSFNWSLASCDMHPVRSLVQKNLYKLAISEISDAWTILPVILQVEIFVCSVALGLVVDYDFLTETFSLDSYLREQK